MSTKFDLLLELVYFWKNF